MAITKKLICFARLEKFEEQLEAGNILDHSIVFIQDAKKIWTHGTYYGDCSELNKQVSDLTDRVIELESIIKQITISVED